MRSAHFWLSGNDLMEEGIFSWSSNGRPITFKRWLSGQPDNAGGNENCVEMYDHQWNDNKCQNDMYFVCE